MGCRIQIYFPSCGGFQSGLCQVLIYVTCVLRIPLSDMLIIPSSQVRRQMSRPSPTANKGQSWGRPGLM